MVSNLFFVSLIVMAICGILNVALDRMIELVLPRSRQIQLSSAKANLICDNWFEFAVAVSSRARRVLDGGSAVLRFGVRSSRLGGVDFDRASFRPEPDLEK